MDELEARIAALERALTDEECDFSELATEAETHTRLADIEAQFEELTDRVAEVEAATQALRGYVGNVRAVNRDVEKRADLALSKVESLAATQGGEPTRSPKTNQTEETANHHSSTHHTQSDQHTHPTEHTQFTNHAHPNENPQSNHQAHPGQHADDNITATQQNSETVPTGTTTPGTLGDSERATEKNGTSSSVTTTGQHSVPSDSVSPAKTVPTRCPTCRNETQTTANGSQPPNDGGVVQEPHPSEQSNSESTFETDELFKPDAESPENGTFERIRKLL